LLNAGRVELLDQQRLIAQLVGLERRRARSGKDLISHEPNGHDNVVNAAALALVFAYAARPGRVESPVCPPIGSRIRPISWVETWLLKTIDDEPVIEPGVEQPAQRPMKEKIAVSPRSDVVFLEKRTLYLCRSAGLRE